LFTPLIGGLIQHHPHALVFSPPNGEGAATTLPADRAFERLHALDSAPEKLVERLLNRVGFAENVDHHPELPPLAGGHEWSPTT
jgi:hypothetical protein